MPILRGAVTFSRFRVVPAGEPPRDHKQWLTRGLKPRAFEPIDRRGEDERAAGFVELEDTDATEFSVGTVFNGEYALFGWRVDQLKISASALRDELEKWSRIYEAEKGQPPRRAEKNEQRALIRQQLRNRATPSKRVFDVSWNLKTGQLQVWAASRKAIDEVHEAISKAFDVKLLPLIPSAMAESLGIPEAALGPTTELCWPNFDGEVSDGQA